jgi:hypothetical protein
VYDANTHLQLAAGELRDRQRSAASDAYAVRLVRLRRLDRRAQAAASRARLARLALDPYPAESDRALSPVSP